jgi:hypothetical protein
VLARRAGTVPQIMRRSANFHLLHIPLDRGCAPVRRLSFSPMEETT